VCVWYVDSFLTIVHLFFVTIMCLWDLNLKLNFTTTTTTTTYYYQSNNNYKDSYYTKYYHNSQQKQQMLNY